MKKLRLLLFEHCNRSCEGCCNKQWDLSELPVCTDYSPYDMIILTGGEPMLRPAVVKNMINMIRKYNDCPIILYTAKTNNIEDLCSVIFKIDGITITLHEQSDVDNLYRVIQLCSIVSKPLTKRLNVFSNVGLPKTARTTLNFFGWEIKDNIEWIEDCPLPEDEEFMRI